MLKLHISAVAPFLKIYSSGSTDFFWRLCCTLRKAQQSIQNIGKTCHNHCWEKKKQLPLSAERPEGRDPDCCINFLLFSVRLPRRCTLHFPSSDTWCSPASEIGLCVYVETLKTVAIRQQGSSSLFLSFDVIIPGAADSKSSSPPGLVKAGGLSWTGSSSNEVYGFRKGGKGRGLLPLRVLGRGLATPVLFSLDFMYTIIFWLWISGKLNKSGENSRKIKLLCLFINGALNMICWVDFFLFFFLFFLLRECNWPLHNSTREHVSLALVLTRCLEFYSQSKFCKQKNMVCKKQHLF